MPRRVALLLSLLLAFPAFAADKAMTVWKSPSCGCCQGWVDYMRKNGYAVTVVETDEMDAVKQKHGVPSEMQSCHTAKIGKYVLEGHVPAEAVDKLLAEKPDFAGIASPGMPMGSPGMNGPKEPNPIYGFGGAAKRKLLGVY